MSDPQEANKKQEVSKRQQIRDKQRRQERINRFLMIGGIAIIAVFVVAIMVSSTLPRAIGTVLTPEPISRPQVKFNTMGDPNAPVKIIEYADFQCPYCMNFYRDTEAQIIEEYVKTGKVYFEYYPVVIIGEESARASEATYCAGDQEKFWEMHDYIYANQGAERSGALRDDRLRAFAADYVKLDMTKFNECFNGGKYKTKVADGVKDAMAKVKTASNFQDVTTNENYPVDGLSTPTFMVNDIMVPGAQPFMRFKQVIDEALAAAGK